MNENSKLGCEIPVLLKTISPVHIGGNTVLSPLADYWLSDNNMICLLDSDKLSAKIFQMGQTERFIKAVQDIANEKKSDFLEEMIRHDLRADIKEFLTGEEIPAFGIENPIEIDGCIKTDGSAYIPGSSLKGAIRSAILQDWLSSGLPGSNFAIDEFLKQLLYFLDRNDLSKTKQKTEIENVFRETMEEKLFGRLKDNKRLAASCLRVTDSDITGTGNIAIYQIERFNLLSGDRNIPVLKECINNGCCFTTTISIDYLSCPQKVFHPLFRDINNKEQLFALLNRCSLQLIGYEQNKIYDKNVDRQKLKDYVIFLSELKDKIADASNNKAYIRLGFGKMQFYQTIALGIFKRQGEDEYDDKWAKYLRYCDDLNEDVASIYPVTRVLTSSSMKQLGWVELS